MCESAYLASCCHLPFTGGGLWGSLRVGGALAADSPAARALRDGVVLPAGQRSTTAALNGQRSTPVNAGGGLLWREHVAAFARLHRDGCLRLARGLALGFGRCVATSPCLDHQRRALFPRALVSPKA